MGKEKRPLQSERINRYLFCFWFQVIRQDDLSNRDFPQFLLHPVGEADRLCRTAGPRYRGRTPFWRLGDLRGVYANLSATPETD